MIPYYRINYQPHKTIKKKHTYITYTLWLFNLAMENPLQMEVLMGTSTINVPFSQREPGISQSHEAFGLLKARLMVKILSERPSRANPLSRWIVELGEHPQEFHGFFLPKNMLF